MPIHRLESSKAHTGFQNEMADNDSWTENDIASDVMQEDTHASSRRREHEAELEKLVELAEALHRSQMSTTIRAQVTFAATLICWALAFGAGYIAATSLAVTTLVAATTASVVLVFSGLGAMLANMRYARYARIDRRSLREVLEILRETIDIYATRYEWSPLRKAEVRIRLMRFDIGEQSPFLRLFRGMLPP